MTSPIWDSDPWPTLPPLSGERRADVCVVGLGGSGLAAVHELLRLGRSVIGIDAGTVGGGAAGRNGGFLLGGAAGFYHQLSEDIGRARARALYRLTLHEIERMRAETPQQVRLTGSLRIGHDARELADCADQYAAMHDDELPVERYLGPEGRGLLFPADGAFQPLARCRTLATRAIAGGAQLFEQTAALAIAGDRVETDGGVARCERVIVAVDGKLEVLIPELAQRVRTSRLQMLATAPEPRVAFPRPVYYRYGYEYWQQLPTGEIALGGFRDAGGDAEWTTDTEPTEAIQDRLEEFLIQRLGVLAPITHRWGASVGYTDDGMPVFAEVRPGVWAIGGYNGTGNVVGALCGRAAAHEVWGEGTEVGEVVRG